VGTSHFGQGTKDIEADFATDFFAQEDPKKLIYSRDFLVPPEIPEASPKTKPQQLIWASDSSAEGIIDLNDDGHTVARYRNCGWKRHNRFLKVFQIASG
jgi:hypothetical protein